jgi:phosphoglycolate phosphatase
VPLPFAVVLFDLDGTITDPQSGITSCVAHALADAGIVVDDPATLRGYIGPPLRDGFAHFHGLEGPHGERAVAVYRERYLAEGIFDLEIVAGMPELVADLHQAGVVVAIATSKATTMAESIVEHVGLTDVVAFVGGATLDGSRGTKDEIIAHTLAALRERGVALVDDDGLAVAIAMVGDRHHDIEGARRHGLTAIGVRWGFADPGELEAAGADVVVADVEALRAGLGVA